MSLQNKIIQSLYMRCDHCKNDSRTFMSEKSTEIIKILKDEGWTNTSFYEKTLNVEFWLCPSCAQNKIDQEAKLLVQFEDLLNQYGESSIEVVEFRKLYVSNKSMTKSFNTAIQIQKDLKSKEFESKIEEVKPTD